VAKAKKKAARKTAAPGAAVSADVLSAACKLRTQAATERHGGTSLAMRVAALEMLVASLTG
jgi:hypothetical protein